MAMIVGSVSVASDGTETKSGMAEAIYDALKVSTAAQIAPIPLQTGPEGAAVLQGLAATATGIAALVTYIQDNAQLRVFGSDAGLQKTPNPNDPNTPTLAPGTSQTFGEIL